MALYQRARTAVGGVAAAASTNFLLGRYTSYTTNQTVHHVAARRLNAAVSNRTSTAYRWAGQQMNFTSSTPTKVVEAGTNKGSGGFVAWYEGHLSARPVTTKAVTGAFLWGLGDFVAQVVPAYFEEDTNGDGDECTDAPKKDFKYDFPRTARAVIFGFVIHAPLSHVHYNFLEWMTVRAGFTGLSIPVFKTIMEQVRLLMMREEK